MPYRKTPLVNGHYYHVFNRGLNRQPTFTSRREYNRATTSVWYYRFQDTPISLHAFLGLPENIKVSITNNLENTNRKHVEVVSYCFMPNHFHFLLKQVTDNGISKFLSDFQNSYTRYFNKRHEIEGSLFISRFKSVLVETDKQLLHLSRYIHLNPFTSSLVKSLEEIFSYPYSSIGGILGTKVDNTVSGFEQILSNFKNTSSFKDFVSDHAEYQRSLHKIKHLVLEG